MDLRNICGLSILMAVFILTQNDICVTSAVAAVSSMLKNFTVNGQNTTVTSWDGASLTFQCARLDNVGEPTLTLKAVNSGKFILGGPGFILRSTSITTTITATCNSSDVYECKATDDAGNVDSKTVEVKVQCGSGGGDNGVEVLKAGQFTLFSLLIVTSLRRFFFQ